MLLGVSPPTASLPAMLDSGRLSDGCKANINSCTSALGEPPFKTPSPLALLQQADMSNISCHSRVSICIRTPGPYGGGLGDICSEHDPVWPYGGLTGTRNRTFFSLPLLKRSVSSTTQKLRFNQASSNTRLLSGPMKFNFHQRNKGEFSFVEHLNKAKARIFFFFFF